MEVDPVTKKRQLDRIAERLLKMAEAGDIQAIKEVGDRLDGKAIQAIDATVDANVTVNVLRFTDAIDAGAGDADGQST